MAGIELVVAALATGAAGSHTEAASRAVQDAGVVLRDAVRRSLATCGEGSERVLDATELSPDVWQSVLSEELRAFGAGREHELIATAGTIRTALDPKRAAMGKHYVYASRAMGVQTGDHNTQTNAFI